MELIKALASKFGVVATPDAILEAADHLVELRSTVSKQIGLSATAANSVLLKAVLDDASVRAKYVPLLSALGVENPDAALDKIATMMADSAKLAEISPEFSALKAKAAEGEQAVADEEVETAVASTGVTASSEHYDGLKIALSTLRKTDRKAFDAKYPKEKLDATRAALASKSATSTVSAAVNAALLTTKVAATNNQAAPAAGGGGQGGLIDVSSYEGPNKIMRTCSFIRSTVAGAKDWTHDRVHKQAVELCRSGSVTG